MNNYRSEIKFVCYKHNYSLIKNWIRFHKFNFFKEYDDRNINNIYFDSLDYKAFNDNLVGLPSRLKVRYRWYGNLFSNVSMPVCALDAPNKCSFFAGSEKTTG